MHLGLNWVMMWFSVILFLLKNLEWLWERLEYNNLKKVGFSLLEMITYMLLYKDIRIWQSDLLLHSS